METQLICHNQTFLKHILKTKLATQRKTDRHFENYGHLEKDCGDNNLVASKPNNLVGKKAWNAQISGKLNKSSFALGIVIIPLGKGGLVFGDMIVPALTLKLPLNPKPGSIILNQLEEETHAKLEFGHGGN